LNTNPNPKQYYT